VRQRGTYAGNADRQDRHTLLNVLMAWNNACYDTSELHYMTLYTHSLGQ